MKSKFSYYPISKKGNDGKIIIKKINGNNNKHVETEYILQWHRCTNEFVVFSERKMFTNHEIERNECKYPRTIIKIQKSKSRIYYRLFNIFRVCHYCNKELGNNDYFKIFVKHEIEKTNYLQANACLKCHTTKYKLNNMKISKKRLKNETKNN